MYDLSLILLDPSLSQPDVWFVCDLLDPSLNQPDVWFVCDITWPSLSHPDVWSVSDFTWSQPKSARCMICTCECHLNCLCFFTAPSTGCGYHTPSTIFVEGNMFAVCHMFMLCSGAGSVIFINYNFYAILIIEIFVCYKGLCLLWAEFGPLGVWKFIWIKCASCTQVSDISQNCWYCWNMTL
jgi:hypothetical protein